jgi:hypothetical protein
MSPTKQPQRNRPTKPHDAPAGASHSAASTPGSSASPGAIVASGATALATPINAVERVLERGVDRVWVAFRHRPYFGAALAGGVGLTIASMLGAAEIAIGVGVGYATYQILKNRVPPAQALREAFHLESDELAPGK